MARKASTAVAKAAPDGAKPIDIFRQRIGLQRQNIQPLLPAHLSFEKFQATLIAAVVAKPDLLDVDQRSLFKASVEAAELGLSLNPALGEADILKNYNTKIQCYEAQFRPRYGGLMKLARQSGDVKSIEAVNVHKNDAFEYEKGLEPVLRHKPALGDRGPKTHVYCVWMLADGTKQFEVMDREQVMAVRARSSSKNKGGEVVGPWVTDEDEMWRKTVVKRASKYMPRSANAFSQAVAMDNARESGMEAWAENGDVFVEAEDITAPQAPAEKPVQDLEQKVTAKKAEAAKDGPPALEKVVPKSLEDGTWDWVEWAGRAAAAALACPADRREEWAKLHAKALASAEFAEPDAAEKVKKAMNGEGYLG